MPTITIRIEAILADPDNPHDLSTLPPDEAASEIRALYGFLPR